MHYGLMRTLLAVAITTLALPLVATEAQAQQARPDRIAGEPNLNGIWQAINAANWNLECGVRLGRDLATWLQWGYAGGAKPRRRRHHAVSARCPGPA